MILYLSIGYAFVIANTFIITAAVSYFIHFSHKLNIGALLMGVFIFIIQNLSYFHTFIANPGLARDRQIEDLKQGYRFCSVCKIHYDPEDTRHCCFCNACIYGHDHHCPWTGKCIGKKTLYSFFSFVVFTFVLILYMFLALVFNNDKF